jgi:chemotaxis protein MotB
MDERPPIVIVRRKKKGHAAHHGGAWKVAYADFVTAMMAFFLVMWLVTSVSPEKRASVSRYFKTYNIFDRESGTSVMQKSTQTVEAKLGLEQKALVQMNAKKTTRGTAREETGTESTPEDIARKLRSSIDTQLASFRDQVLVDTTDDGVRVQIVDAEGSLMFPLGSAQPTERAKQILALVAGNMRELPNKVAIEGHTDAAPFKGAETTNWELSTARASAARRELEKNGVTSGRIARVVGYADQELYARENPRDPRNRRISIILLNRIDPPPLTE